MEFREWLNGESCWYEGATSRARAGQKKLRQGRFSTNFEGPKLHIIHTVGLAKMLDAIDASQAVHEPVGLVQEKYTDACLRSQNS